MIEKDGWWEYKWVERDGEKNIIKAHNIIKCLTKLMAKKNMFMWGREEKYVQKEFQPVAHSERKIANRWMDLNFCLHNVSRGARHL